MRDRYLLMAFISLMIVVNLIPFATFDLDISAAGDSSISIVGFGALSSGFSLTGVSQPQPFEQSSTWTWSSTSDYLSFRDSSSTAGFRIDLFLSSSDLGKFVYTGNSDKQENISVENFTVWGGYVDNPPYPAVYAPPSKGVDTPNLTLNINSALTCWIAQDVDNYVFHPDLTNYLTNYGLTMSSSHQTYLRSFSQCEVAGELDIRRMRLIYPPGANSGRYESILYITILDGAG
jgi:hypothetical protein